MFTFNRFCNDFFRSLVITLPDHGVMQFCQKGIFQSNSSFLLKIFKGISVIMLPKVFEAETNGFSLTILKGKKRDDRFFYWFLMMGALVPFLCVGNVFVSLLF